MKKIMVVIGTRPEAIKMCPIIIEMKHREKFDVCVCSTGQHKEMLFQVLDFFSIIPEYSLNVMRDNQELTDLSIVLMSQLKNLLCDVEPDLVMIHGDTTTAFVTALVCFYLRIEVAHVEAGLRTNNINLPFPEEFNRKTIDAISKYHFAPTKEAFLNLLNEKISQEHIYVTGNTVIDSLLLTYDKEFTHPELEWAKDSKLILLTLHRREIQNKILADILEAINLVVREIKDVKIIFPVHKNKKIRDISFKILGENERIHLIEPLNIYEFHNFERNSYAILSDSGGIQEEASFLGKPLLIIRDVTERMEGVREGNIKLIGTQKEVVYSELKKIIEDSDIYKKMSFPSDIYGMGNASRRIVDILEKEIC